MESTDTVNVYATLKDGDRDRAALPARHAAHGRDRKYRPDGAAMKPRQSLAAAAAEMPSVG